MEREKKPRMTTYEVIVKFFKSRIVKNICFLLLLAVSVFLMIMLDENNSMRDKIWPALNNNIIKDIMSWLNIKHYNISVASWLLFVCIIMIVTIFIIANMLSPNFVEKPAQKHQKNFKSLHSARVYYGVFYYLIVLLIAAVAIFIFYMAGGFSLFSVNSAGYLVGLLYCLLLLLIFIAVIVFAILIAYYAVKGIVLLISFIISIFARFVRDIMDEDYITVEADDLKAEGGDGDGKGSGNGEEEKALDKDIFPALTAIDLANEEKPAEETEGETVEEEQPAEEKEIVTLDEFVKRFQSFAINKHKMYYQLSSLRSFVAGLATSRLIILEGLSGTGKSMLPRMFGEFIGSAPCFHPVQQTWRDKSDTLGYYSEFSKIFRTTDFLKNLYAASYKDNVNMMVLDELNLSRIEYYFADFLSILEYPQDEWKVRVYEPEVGQKLPAKLEGGYVTIPANTWFIGTANTDDSTFTITDKVYDRSVVLKFNSRFATMKSDYNSDPVNINAEELTKLFEDAKNDENNRLNEEDIKKFIKISDFAQERLDVCFGNRIMNQIEEFVPVYVAMGGTKEEALDFMFTNKILRKIENSVEGYLKDELNELLKLIASVYGKGTFANTEALIAKIIRRLV